MATTYNTSSHSFEFAYSPQEVWPLIADPSLSSQYEKDLCYHVERDAAFQPVEGWQWQEVHTGPDCEGDRVTQTLTAIEPPYFIEFAGVQLGTHMRVQRRLTSTKTGCLLEETIRFSPSLKGGFGPSAMFMRAITLLGLTPKLSQDAEKDVHWCTQLNLALARRYDGAA